MSATTRGLISFMYLDNYGTHVNTLPVNVSCKGNVSLGTQTYFRLSLVFDEDAILRRRQATAGNTSALAG